MCVQVRMYMCVHQSVSLKVFPEKDDKNSSHWTEMNNDVSLLETFLLAFSLNNLVSFNPGK